MVFLAQDYFAQFQLDLSDEATLQSALVQGDASNMFQDLKDQFHHKSATRRPLFTIPFILGEDLEIGVQGFSLVTETKKGLAVTVDTSGRHVQIVKSIVTYDDKDSGQRLSKKDLRPYYPVGGKSDSGEPAHKIVFNDDEIKALKTMGMKPCKLSGGRVGR